MNLSKHFTLEEFTATQHRGIDNDMPAELYPAAQGTCEMLERIRDFLSTVAGKDIPITISSGYRCLELNRAIGSKDTSDHVRAWAVDWKAPTFGTPYFVAMALKAYVDDLIIGQLIYEFGSWIHTSTREPDKKLNRILTIDSNGTQVGI